tara:strand:+ start:338 stop:697 length:360 start_codon:yes stop_codon:yes gene_type:complete
MSKLNTSGWKPYDIGVLVKIEKPEERKTKGGIILHSAIEAVSHEAVNNGVMVDMAGQAFKARDSEGNITVPDDAPKIGETVVFAKYSGEFLYSHMTDDEQEYRLMDSPDVRAKRSIANG